MQPHSRPPVRGSQLTSAISASAGPIAGARLPDQRRRFPQGDADRPFILKWAWRDADRGSLSQSPVGGQALPIRMRGRSRLTPPRTRVYARYIVYSHARREDSGECAARPSEAYDVSSSPVELRGTSADRVGPESLRTRMDVK